MRNKLNGLLLLIGLIYSSSCKQAHTHSQAEGSADSTAISSINAAGFTEHIGKLASDSFQGRKPFSKGETLAIDYIKNQFQKLKLLPGNGQSYFQDVPMVEVTSTPGTLTITGTKGNLSLNYLTDFVAVSRHESNEINIVKSDLFFVGFGIKAPEYGWDDYQGLDVKGKTVIVMVNDPGFYDSTLFKGKTMTYYGRWTYKYEEAARQGAAGCIIIHDTAPASYPWTVVRSSFSGSKLYLKEADKGLNRAGAEAWITTDAANKLFKLAGHSDDLLAQAKTKGFKAVDLHLEASLKLVNEIKYAMSHNVVARLEGTTHANEYIIYSAHWDHLGIGEAVKGDSIYNGAIDNATGCAAILEIAKAFTLQSKKPERSIVFIALTSEEQGLLGSEYYGTHPIYPVKKTVADINIDALSSFGITKDISVIGFGQSELDEYAKASALKQNRVTMKEPNPSAGAFFRSDHFNFAKVGIPSLYTESGINSIAHGSAWGKAQSEDYTAHRYHQSADNFEPATWDFSGMVEDTRLLYDVGNTLANERNFPSWKTGSEFKVIREKSLR